MARPVNADELTTTWRPWPGRIAVSKPPCSTPGCRKPASRWTRCRCGAPIASCGDCRGLDEARKAHACRQ